MAVVLLIALLAGAVYVDARHLAARSPEIYMSTLQVGPFGWLALTVCFSGVGATVYLFRRRRVLAEIAAAEQAEARTGEGAVSRLHDVHEYTTVITATGVTIVALLIGIALNLVYVLANMAIGRTGPSIADASLLALGTKLVFLGTILWFGARAGRSPRELLSVGTKLSFAPDVLLPIVLGAALAAAAYLTGIGQSTIPVSPVGVLASESGSVALLVYAVVAVLTAPVLEELIFRGYYYRAVARVKGHRFALVAITGAFWLAHAGQLGTDWASFAVIFAASLVITLLRMYRGSVIPGIIAHFVYNAALIVIPFVMLVSNAPLYSYITSRDAPPPEREQLLRELIAADPEYAPAYNDLAWLYATNDGDLDEALSLVDHALTTEPFNSAYLDTRAEILFRLGRAADAVEIEQRLADANPTDAYFRTQLDRFRATATDASP